MQNTELRPLGAGELLDRAVTLFVRRFVPIVIVLAVAIVPLIAIEAILAPHSGRVFTDMARVFSTVGNTAAQRAAQRALSADNTGGAALAGLLVVGGVVRLLMWSAVVSLIASAYAGTPQTIVQAYRVGLQRWLPQLVVGLAFAVIGIIAAIPLLIAYVVIVFVVIAMAAINQTALTIAVGVIGGLAFFAALAIAGAWIYMTYQVAAVAVVTETANPFDAVGAAMRRGLARGMRWRTVVGGLVIVLVTYGGTLPLIAIAGLAVAATHQDALYFAVLGAGNVLLEGLIAAFVVVYAVDVRVRREGWDIIAAETPPAIA